MEPAAIGNTPFPFETVGDAEATNIVEKPEFRDGKVWINPTQFFNDAPEVSWGFYIGGYQPRKNGSRTAKAAN